jgi:Domain of unknown function (DUF4258)
LVACGAYSGTRRKAIEKSVRYRLSTHAEEEVKRRKIPLALLEATLERPGQVVSERGHLKAYQSKCDIDGKMFLLRVVVDDSADPAVVVTAYRTTRIEKYWGKP